MLTTHWGMMSRFFSSVGATFGLAASEFELRSNGRKLTTPAALGDGAALELRYIGQPAPAPAPAAPAPAVPPAAAAAPAPAPPPSPSPTTGECFTPDLFTIAISAVVTGLSAALIIAATVHRVAGDRMGPRQNSGLPHRKAVRWDLEAVDSISITDLDARPKTPAGQRGRTGPVSSMRSVSPAGRASGTPAADRQSPAAAGRGGGGAMPAAAREAMSEAQRERKLLLDPEVRKSQVDRTAERRAAYRAGSAERGERGERHALQPSGLSHQYDQLEHQVRQGGGGGGRGGVMQLQMQLQAGTNAGGLRRYTPPPGSSADLLLSDGTHLCS